MEKLAIGLVRGKHGLKGELKVKSFSGESEHFFPLRQILLRRGESQLNFKVEHVRGHDPAILIKLEGVETPEDASNYHGWEVWADREYASPLFDNEYYVADLCCCTLVTGTGEKLKIKNVWEGAPVLMLEVELDSREIKLIPFQKEFIGTVDIEKKTIELLSDWLLE
jgi:16S rRNA processing protein RimM